MKMEVGIFVAEAGCWSGDAGWIETKNGGEGVLGGRKVCPLTPLKTGLSSEEISRS